VAIFLALAVAVVALAHTAPFPFLLEAFTPRQSVWRMAPQPAGPAVYLTFDDGPNVEWTPPLLDALAEEGATATFFLIDEHLTDQSAPIVRRIAAEGHAIGLHSGSRRLMVEDPDDLAARLARQAERIRAIAARRRLRVPRAVCGLMATVRILKSHFRILTRS